MIRIEECILYRDFAEGEVLRDMTILVETYKKLVNAALIADTDAAVATVAVNPDVGERKMGDLAQLWVHKFRSQGQLYLLGYSREDTVRLVYLEALGPHENFYRDVKG